MRVVSGDKGEGSSQELTRSLLEALGRAEISIKITEKGLSSLYDEALPDWYARLGMGSEVVCLLVAIGMIIQRLIHGAGWEVMLAIPSFAIAHYVTRWLPMGLFLAVGCLVVLARSIKPLHWLQVVLGFYAYTSIVKRISLWFATDRLKRMTFGCDENVLFMVNSGFAVITPTRTASARTRLLVESLYATSQHAEVGDV